MICWSENRGTMQRTPSRPSLDYVSKAWRNELPGRTWETNRTEAGGCFDLMLWQT